MTAPTPLHIAGERLMLDPSGGLYWPAARLLVVSDLHLEKGSAAARHGRLLPPYDSRITLDRLAALLRQYPATRLLALGDSFHDADGISRLAEADRARLSALAMRAEILWMLGNHDAGLATAGWLPGTLAAAWREGPFLFRHAAEAGCADLSTAEAGSVEISGHYHPKARLILRGATITRPCFITDGRERMILPAFGSYTGGLDVTDPAIARLFPRGGRVFLLGQDRLFHFRLGNAAKRGAAA